MPLLQLLNRQIGTVLSQHLAWQCIAPPEPHCEISTEYLSKCRWDGGWMRCCKETPLQRCSKSWTFLQMNRIANESACTCCLFKPRPPCPLHSVNSLPQSLHFKHPPLWPCLWPTTPFSPPHLECPALSCNLLWDVSLHEGCCIVIVAVPNKKLP